MRKYRPSNRVPFGGFILLLLIAVVSGAILGGILWAIDDLLHFYLVIVFPLFAGAIAGGLFRVGVRTSKVRSPFFAALTGILAGLVMFGVYHFADYYSNLQSAGYQPKMAVNELVDYLKLYAETGFTITNSTYGTTDDNPMELKGDLVWGYWGIEILLAAGIAGWLVGKEANQPFDEESNSWYGSSSRLGITTTKNSKVLTNALKEGNWQQAGSLLTTQQIKYPCHEVLLRRSRTPSAVPQQDIYLTVNYAQRSNRTVVKYSGLVSPSELDLIKRSMQTQPQSVAARR